MRYEPIPELRDLPETERVRIRLAVALGIFKDPRVWGAYAAQVAGFVLLFFVFFPKTEHKVLLVLAYAIPTMLAVKALQRHVFRERVIALLADEAGA